MWTDEAEDHIARHGVEPYEVEEVLDNRPLYEHHSRDDATMHVGTTTTGRHLVVITTTAAAGRLYVVTARPMTTSERRAFRRKGTMTMTRKRLDQLRNHYDRADLSAQIEQAAEVTEPAPTEPMVTYALRLPQPVMDQLRQSAQARGVRVSVLMRQWLEERLADDTTDEDTTMVVPVGDLLAFLGEHRRPIAKGA